jgi:hypothetical protein
MATVNTVRLGIIRGFLEEDPLMPKRYQNPKLEVRKDVNRPYYFVRVSLPRVGKDGVRKKPAKKNGWDLSTRSPKNRP